MKQLATRVLKARRIADVRLADEDTRDLRRNIDSLLRIDANAETPNQPLELAIRQGPKHVIEPAEAQSLLCVVHDPSGRLSGLQVGHGKMGSLSLYEIWPVTLRDLERAGSMLAAPMLVRARHNLFVAVRPWVESVNGSSPRHPSSLADVSEKILSELLTSTAFEVASGRDGRVGRGNPDRALGVPGMATA